MGVFADIKLAWGDKEYVIPAKKVMGAIFRIENVLTIKELYDASAGGNIKFSKLSAAYGEALRYAGATVTETVDGEEVTRPISDDEVYCGMFQGEEGQLAVISAVAGLLSMMIPPDANKGSAKAKPGNAPKPPKAAAPSSKKRSR